MATNIVLNPPPMQFGLDIVLSEDTYPFVDPDALKMRFGLTMRHESISGAIVELLPQPMRFGLTIGQGSPVVGSLPMRFGLTMQVGQVLYPKLTTKSPIAYVLEIHALGDEPSDMPGFGVITDAINPQWNASLGGIDTLTFTYKADDAKTANLDITHEVWIRRYDSGEIKQRFLLWKKRTYRTHTEVRIDYTYTSLMSQLQKVDIDATCLSGTRLDDILGRVLAEQTQTTKITLGGLDGSLFSAPTGLGSQSTAYDVIRALESTHGGYFSVRNWKLYWTAEPNHSSPYPILQYRKNLLGLEQEDDYSDSDAPDEYYRIDVASLADVESSGLGPGVMYPGQMVNIYDEDLGIDEDLRVIKVNHRNLHKPYDIEVAVGARVQTLTDITQDTKQKLADLPGEMGFIEIEPNVWRPGFEIQVTQACVVGDVMCVVMEAYDQGATNCSDDWAGNDHGEPNRYWGLADNRTESKINGDLVVVVEAAGAGEMARAVLRGEVEYDMSAGLTPGSEGCGIEQKPIYLGYDGKMSLSIPSAGEYGRVLGRTSADKVSINIDKVWVLMADTFDPWTYDTDGDGVISKTEYHAAVVDYNAGTITEDEKAQVQTLFIDGGVFS